MIYSGLLSVTFRKLAPDAIVRLVSEAGLQSIEWGGDIHVPHGDVKKAAEIRKMTEETGLRIASYGSYYKTAVAESPDFAAVLETAVALGAPSIRVWAGNIGSDKADKAWRDRVVQDSLRIAELAHEAGVTVDFEYHGGTLTDTHESTASLLQELPHPAIRSNWQPPVPQTAEQRLEGLRQVVPRLANIHVFHWLPGQRLPLAEGFDDWLAYTRLIKQIDQAVQARYMMLEFVRDENPEQFLHDADTLKRLLAEA